MNDVRPDETVTKNPLTPAAWAELVAARVVERLAVGGMSVPNGDWSQVSGAVHAMIIEFWSTRP